MASGLAIAIPAVYDAVAHGIQVAGLLDDLIQQSVCGRSPFEVALERRFGRRELFGLFAFEFIKIGLEGARTRVENQDAH